MALRVLGRFSVRRCLSITTSPSNFCAEMTSACAARNRVGFCRAELKAAGPVDRILVLTAISHEPGISAEEKRQLFSLGIRSFVADFSWELLHEFVSRRKAVFSAADSCPDAMNKLLMVSVHELSSCSHITDGMVLDVLSLFAFLRKPPKDFLVAMKQERLQHRLAEPIKAMPANYGTARSLSEFLVRLANLLDTDKLSFSFVPLLKAILDNLAESIPMQKVLSTGEFSHLLQLIWAMKELGMRHEGCLKAAVSQLMEFLSTEDLDPELLGPIGPIARGVQSLSDLRHKSQELLFKVSEAYRKPSCSWHNEEDLRSNIYLGWAYEYHGRHMPKGLAIHLCRMLENEIQQPMERQQQTMPWSIAPELAQILPALPRDVVGLDSFLRNAFWRVSSDFRCVWTKLSERNDYFKTDFMTERGHVLAAGLFDRDRRFFAEWPPGLEVSQLKPSILKELPNKVQPVAALAFPLSRSFKDPISMIDGVLQMHLAELKEKGWAVCFVRELELLDAVKREKKGKASVADWLVKEMAQAVLKDALIKKKERQRKQEQSREWRQKRQQELQDQRDKAPVMWKSYQLKAPGPGGKPRS